MGAYGEICGHPMRYYELSRPRDDFFPVCHRPPGHAEREQAAGRFIRHMSKASVDAERKRGRENRWKYGKARKPVLSGPAVTVAA